jgi:hypothetical protein
MVKGVKNVSKLIGKTIDATILHCLALANRIITLMFCEV